LMSEHTRRAHASGVWMPLTDELKGAIEAWLRRLRRLAVAVEQADDEEEEGEEEEEEEGEAPSVCPVHVHAPQPAVAEQFAQQSSGPVALKSKRSSPWQSTSCSTGQVPPPPLTVVALGAPAAAHQVPFRCKEVGRLESHAVPFTRMA
jgi:hypothetical protein